MNARIIEAERTRVINNNLRYLLEMEIHDLQELITAIEDLPQTFETEADLRLLKAELRDYRQTLNTLNTL
jgi:cell shape-determining protein MreC